MVYIFLVYDLPLGYHSRAIMGYKEAAIRQLNRPAAISDEVKQQLLI